MLFRRGDTFYGELAPPHGCAIAAYGHGPKPVLTMYKLLNRADGWIEHSPDVWAIDLGKPATHDGYAGCPDANIGYLLVDGAVMPARKSLLSDLAAPWDFWCNVETNMLYVKVPTNPTQIAADIKAAPNGTAFGETGRVVYFGEGTNEIRDMHITGTGGCGIGGVAPDVYVHDCLINLVGGAVLQDGTNRRYGNGIENWVDVKRWLIEGNEITQTYDVAWSAQGRAGTSGGWQDITFRNNYVHRCSQSIEFWSTGSKSSGGFERILVEGNLFERAGYSVFSDVRPDQEVRVHLLTYFLETPVDITIQDNTFDGAYGAYSYHVHEPMGMLTRRNTIRLRRGLKIQHQRRETVEQAATWQKATGREIGSTIKVLE